MGDPKKVLQLNAYDTHFIEVWNNSETKQQVVDERFHANHFRVHARKGSGPLLFIHALGRKQFNITFDDG